MKFPIALSVNSARYLKALDQLIQAKSVLDQPKDREHLDQLLAIRKLRQES